MLTADVLGEDEPLVSHAVDSDIKALKNDSLITSKVSYVFFACHQCGNGFEKFKLKCKAKSVFMR